MKLLKELKSHRFLFEELVKRDFKKKYKRTIMGMGWSVLSPLLTMLVMRLIFTELLGRNMEHFTTYLFCGTLTLSYFTESSNAGMRALLGNAHIFTKVNVPKYLFLLAKNVQTLINFCLTLGVFFLFCVIDHITFTWRILLFPIPILFLVLFNIGIGMILSVLYVFFRDIGYLWSVFIRLLTYTSAIFYSIERFPLPWRNLFYCNPVYCFIQFFRYLVIDMAIPPLWFHGVIVLHVFWALGLGCWMYKKYSSRVTYYV